MKYDIFIPQWMDGKWLRVPDIEADTVDEAKQKTRELVAKIGADVPVDVMSTKLPISHPNKHRLIAWT